MKIDSKVVNWKYVVLTKKEKRLCGGFNKFPDILVQVFKIVIDS